MRTNHVCIIWLFCFMSCCIGITPALSQDGEQMVNCPPNSHWDGTQCKCSPGYGSRDNATCRPLSELAQCPPNSSWDGTQCRCSPGYGSVDDKSCTSLAELAQCPPNSNWDGNKCACIAGYGVFPGDDTCTSYRSMCKRFDSHAVYNPANKDCECVAGYRENAAGNGCDPIAEAPAAPDKKSDSVAHQNSPGTPARQAKDSPAGQENVADLSVRINTFGAPDRASQQTEVIDARSERSGDMTFPVSVGGKTIFMTEAGAEAYRQRAESGDLSANVSIKKDVSIADDFLQQSAGKKLTKEQVNQDQVPWPGQLAPQQVKRAEGSVTAMESIKGKEREPAGETVSSGWWADTAQKPAAASQQKLSATADNGMPDKSGTTKKQDLHSGVGFQQQAEAKRQMETTEESPDKITIPLQPFDIQKGPEIDVYRDISRTGTPILEKTLTDSLQMTPPEKKQEVEEQLKTLSDFKNADTSEVSLEGKGILEAAAEKYVQKEYLKQMWQWREEVKEARETGKVRNGMDKEEYLVKTEMDERLRWQIAEIDKMISYSYLRLIEARGGVKFDHMSRDYREHFGNKAASDDTTEPALYSAEEVESHKAFLNIVGLKKQLKEMKEQYKNSYPQGWQNEYLDLPEKPRIEPLQKEVNDNIFVIFEKKMSQ